MSRDKVRKGKKPPYMEIEPQIYGKRKRHMTITEKKRIQAANFRSKIIPQFSSTRTNHSSKLPAFYLVQPWLTTLLLPLAS